MILRWNDCEQGDANTENQWQLGLVLDSSLGKNSEQLWAAGSHLTSLFKEASVGQTDVKEIFGEGGGEDTVLCMIRGGGHKAGEVAYQRVAWIQLQYRLHHLQLLQCWPTSQRSAEQMTHCTSLADLHAAGMLREPLRHLQTHTYVTLHVSQATPPYVHTQTMLESWNHTRTNVMLGKWCFVKHCCKFNRLHHSLHTKHHCYSDALPKLLIRANRHLRPMSAPWRHPARSLTK